MTDRTARDPVRSFCQYTYGNKKCIPRSYSEECMILNPCTFDVLCDLSHTPVEVIV